MTDRIKRNGLSFDKKLDAISSDNKDKIENEKKLKGNLLSAVIKVGSSAIKMGGSALALTTGILTLNPSLIVAGGAGLVTTGVKVYNTFNKFIKNQDNK
ncbi:MAG: hypothetical protein K1060chlam4_00942 [Candidatus Anoxychlamydiales bacterium]|nr:hypothetical protein [Candidatus Anoxychlamydiales bacterium]